MVSQLGQDKEYACGAALVGVLLIVGSDFIREGQPICKVLVSPPLRRNFSEISIRIFFKKS